MVRENAQPDTFRELLLLHSVQRGEHPALREKRRGIWHTTTWRELADEAAALAAGLSAHGLQRGAHVAFVGDNRPRLYAAICAVHWLGAIALPLYQEATAEELTGPIQTAEITHVFAESQEQVDKLLGILPRCPTLRCVIYDKDRGMRHYRQQQLVAYADLLREGRELGASKCDALQAEAALGSGQDTAFLFFTSGTTGSAKGVVLTHEALIDRGRVIAGMERLTDTDVTMAYLPPGWAGQSLFGYALAMLVGYCVCCPESSETLLADMRDIGPTCFLTTPRVLETLFTDISMRMEDAGGLNQRLYRRGVAAAQRTHARAVAGEAASMGDRIASLVSDLFIYAPLRDVLGLSKVRVAYTAGDAIAPELLMFFRALGINLKQAYGSTETGFFVAIHRDGDVNPETVGPAAEGVELKISPQREILVRSSGLFKEYYRDPETTAQAKTAEGWFSTGDAGYLGDDGHLRVIDRMKYVGALNDGTLYAPRLIESRLKFMPYIKEAVAFGDRRDKVCVLVDIDEDAVGRWADKRNISYSGHADLASRDEVHELISECIAKFNAELALDKALAQARIHRFLILQKELHADDGVLTHTGKLRRGVIAERYGELVEAMYEGRSMASFATEGPVGTVSADLKICDVRVVASAQVTRAA